MSALSIPWFRKLFGISCLWILGQICPSLPINLLELCQHPGFPQELIRMEERQIIRHHKFGVYHLLPGQTLEYQGLANPCGKEPLGGLTKERLPFTTLACDAVLRRVSNEPVFIQGGCMFLGCRSASSCRVCY